MQGKKKKLMFKNSAFTKLQLNSVD